MEDKLKRAIQQMKNGEEKGFNEVYSQTYNRVYFRSKQLMKREEDAQDLVQIVFTEAYKNIHTLQNTEALYAWLDGIAYNQSMKMYRKKKEVLLTEENEGVFDTLENNDISLMPELTADQKETGNIIRGIIEELPELQKTAIIMYYFDGLKVEQIAGIMECSVNTIKSRLNYARKYIKDRVEEKEKKEGYKLHAFGLPAIWFAIKTMSDQTTLTAQAAQNIYNKTCSCVGLKATAITASGTTVAGGATKTGVGAKVASLSTTAKTLIIVGCVAVVGTGATGIVGAINSNKVEDVVEETVEVAEAQSSITEEANIDNLTLEDADLQESTVFIEEEATEQETQPIFELTEKAQRQTSAFVSANFAGVYMPADEETAINFSSMTSDDCLICVNDYVETVNYTWNGGVTPNPDDLPYDWFNYKVTEQEFIDFCKYGLGIEISSDYGYSFENDGGSIKILNGELQSTFDARTVQATGGNVEVVSQDENSIVLSGTCYWYDPEETVCQFIVSGVPSGNSNIFGGMTLTNIEIVESNTEMDAEVSNDLDYHLMAQKCSEVMNNLMQQGLFSEFDGYYLYDIDKDGVSEFILCKGTCNADYQYVVYSFDGTNLLEKGSAPWGATLYGYPDEKALAIQYIQMGYELIFYYDMNTAEKISEKELQMTDDGDFTGGYEFPLGVYKLIPSTDYDEEAVYANIMSKIG